MMVGRHPFCLRLLLAAAGLLFATAAPVAAHPPPIETSINLWGNPVLFRHGREQEYWSFTGWGLEKAFRGVPEAQALARRYRYWATTANSVSLLGTAMFAGGTWYRLREGTDPGRQPGSWAVIISGGVLAVGGTLVAGQAKRLIYDAVNVFNARFVPAIEPGLRTHVNAEGRLEGRLMFDVPIDLQSDAGYARLP